MLEEKTNPRFKSYIIKLVLAVLLLFLLMWLFPTKGFLTKKIDESINEKLDTSAPQLFNENVKIMSDAAQGYFISSRLPQKGNSVKITLGEMLEKHLLVEFTDSKNSTCDKKESYVEVTNENGEYTMKVNLSCTDIKDYVIVYLFPSTVVTSASSNADSCEYKKITNAKWSDYSEWSNWQIEKVLKTDYNQIETKTEKMYIGTKDVLNNEESAPVKEEIKQYVCNSSYDNEGTYSKETTCIKSEEPKEEMRARKVYICDSSYTNEGIYTKYTKCTKEDKAVVNKIVTYVCPSSYDNAGTYNNYVICKKTTYIKEKQYKYVNYYREKTKTLLSGDIDVKWSDCNDKNLINLGYLKTGNVK